MVLNVQYFGLITEIAGKTVERLEVDKISVEALRSLLNDKYPALALVQCKISVNRKIQTTGSIGTSDEVAIMPPFSGG